VLRVPLLSTPDRRRPPLPYRSHGVGGQQEEGRAEEGRRGSQEGRQGGSSLLLLLVLRGRREVRERHRGPQALRPHLHRGPRLPPTLPRHPREQPSPSLLDSCFESKIPMKWPRNGKGLDRYFFLLLRAVAWLPMFWCCLGSLIVSVSIDPSDLSVGAVLICGINFHLSGRFSA
jgi:hypothetical protein